MFGSTIFQATSYSRMLSHRYGCVVVLYHIAKQHMVYLKVVGALTTFHCVMIDNFPNCFFPEVETSIHFYHSSEHNKCLSFACPLHVSC